MKSPSKSLMSAIATIAGAAIGVAILVYMPAIVSDALIIGAQLTCILHNEITSQALPKRVALDTVFYLTVLTGLLYYKDMAPQWVYTAILITAFVRYIYGISSAAMKSYISYQANRYLTSYNTAMETFQQNGGYIKENLFSLYQFLNAEKERGNAGIEIIAQKHAFIAASALSSMDKEVLGEMKGELNRTIPEPDLWRSIEPEVQALRAC